MSRRTDDIGALSSSLHPGYNFISWKDAMKHISYILHDEYEYLLKKKKQLDDEYTAQLKRKRESCEQGSETWHDNRDFEDAERQLHMIGGRISEMQHTIQNTTRILYDALQNTEWIIRIGSLVSLQIGEKTWAYMIGGSPSIPGRISYMSPLWQAILHKKSGESLTFVHNAQSKHIAILSVT